MDNTAFKKRVHGVLDYDHIPSEQRIKHLMQQCGLSKYLANRVLEGIPPRSAHKVVGLAQGLAISIDWLWMGSLMGGNPRTIRIHFFTLGYPQNVIDGLSRLFMGVVAGSKKAENICGLVCDGKLSLLTAGRMM